MLQLWVPGPFRAQWIKLKYLWKASIWTVQLISSGSVVWRKILKAREWVRSKTKYVIFNGTSINLWNDPWLRGHDLQNHFNGAHLLGWGPPSELIASKIITDNSWRKPPRWPTEFDVLWEEISNLEIGEIGPDDLLSLDWVKNWLLVHHYGLKFHQHLSSNPFVDQRYMVFNPTSQKESSLLASWT